jgi:hypothetical protein
MEKTGKEILHDSVAADSHFFSQTYRSKDS